MGIMQSLLDLLGQATPNVPPPPDLGGGAVISNLQTTITLVINAILGIIASLAALFAVYIGFRLAKAEDESKRTEAKKQMLWTIIAIIGVAVIWSLFHLVILPLLGQG